MGLEFLPGRRTVDGYSQYHDESNFGARIATVGAGQLVGELALLNDGTRTATVQCTEHCEFLVIRRTDFDNILKEEMVQKGDEKLKFLMQHMPGMRDVPVPKPGTRPHASYFFRKARYLKGHVFLQQGMPAETEIYVVLKGTVEFFRSEVKVDLGLLPSTAESRVKLINSRSSPRLKDVK